MADNIPENKLKKYFNDYQFPEKAKKEALAIVKLYRGLQIEQAPYEFENGYRRLLVTLRGTIPVCIKGQYYNIPVSIWLMNTHPNNAPICYVKPTADMRINVSHVVDDKGKIYLPYLHSWSPNNSKLETLIQIMVKTFSETPPLYSSRKTSEVSANSTPYPVQNFMPMPGSNVSTPPYPPYQNPSSAYPGYNPNAAASGAGIYPPYPPVSTSGYPSMPSPYPGYPPTSTPPYPAMPTPNATPTPAQPPTSSGTITDEHIIMSLKSAVEDKIRRKLNEQAEQANEEIEILRQTESELNQGKLKLQRIMEKIDREKVDLERNIVFLKEKEAELDSVLTNLTEEKDIDVDEAVTTTAPIYKQILQTFTEEAATEDTIYYMGEALRRGVIDLEVYLKQVRSLSRKQFILRALLFKCYKHLSHSR